MSITNRSSQEISLTPQKEGQRPASAGLECKDAKTTTNILVESSSTQRETQLPVSTISDESPPTKIRSNSLEETKRHRV